MSDCNICNGKAVEEYRCQVPVCHNELNRIRAELKRSNLRVSELKAALDRDKTGLAAGLASINREVADRRWICDGRGSYEYDDERYRKETGWALDAIEKIATDALSASGNLANASLSENVKTSKGGDDE